MFPRRRAHKRKRKRYLDLVTDLLFAATAVYAAAFALRQLWP